MNSRVNEITIDVGDELRSNSGVPRCETFALFRNLVPSVAVRLLGYVGFWTLVAFASALHWWFYPQGIYPYTWWELFAVKASVWYSWAALVPLILWLTSRLRLDGARRWQKLGMLMVTAIAVTMAYLAVYTQWLLWLTEQKPAPELFGEMFSFVISRHSTYYFLAFWAVVAVEHVVAYYARYLERERLTAELKSRLAEAQLERLKDQLQPHFLFNALNTISSLVVSDKKTEAYDTLADLAELLRISLDRNAAEFVSLADELDFSKLYVDVMSRRFPDQLLVEWDVSVDALDAEIPNMILQPLIENAVKYGIDSSTLRQPVSLTAAISEGRLKIAIANSCAAGSSGASNGHGIGLGHLRQRLEHHYGKSQQLSIESKDGQFQVMLSIPYNKIKPAGKFGTGSQTTVARSNRR